MDQSHTRTDPTRGGQEVTINDRNGLLSVRFWSHEVGGAHPFCIQNYRKILLTCMHIYLE